LGGGRRSGWLEMVSGRLVFTTDPTKEIFSWVVPSRLWNGVRVDKDWVVVQTKRERGVMHVEPRFRLQQGSTADFAAELARLIADPAMAGAGAGVATLRYAMINAPSVLVTAIDGTPVWKKAGSHRWPTNLNVLYVGIVEATDLTPTLPAPNTFRWVGLHLEVPPGRRRISLVVINRGLPVTCTLVIDARPDAAYNISKGDGDIPLLTEVRTREISSAECSPVEQDPELVATLELAPGGTFAGIVELDAWSAWLRFGGLTFRNPENGTVVGWNGTQIGLRTGKHKLLVSYAESNPFESFYSMAPCPIEFVAAAGGRYQVFAQRGERITGGFWTAGTWKWHAEVIDAANQTIGTCGDVGQTKKK
jgi:hypothetical protein